MNDLLRFSCTPISAENPDGSGSLVGSGAFIEVCGKKYALTNDHVITDLNGRQGAYHLTHRIDDGYGEYRPVAFGEDVNRVPPSPDLAMVPISDEAWQDVEHSNFCIGQNVFDSTFNPCEGEIFYFAGYPGARATPILDLLNVVAIPYLVQRPPCAQLPEEDENDFVLPYPLEGVWRNEESENVVPALPPGLSGSLVWDTKRVASLKNGIEWEPSMARVAGILKRWDEENSILIGTKVEAISACLTE